MSTTDTEVSNLIVNKLTLSKYKELKTAGTLSETEAYEITDIDTAIETGGANAANRSLSNLNSTGQAVLDAKANDSNVVHKMGSETIAGAKTFKTSPQVPTADENSNDTTSASTAFVKKALTKLNDTVVHITGDEIIKNIKTFTGNIMSNAMYMLSSRVTSEDGVAPSQDVNKYIGLYRKTGDLSYTTALARIQFALKSNNESFLGLYAYKPTGAGSGMIGVYAPADGTPYTSVTAPTEDTETSHQIDTVGARNTKLKNYLPLSGGTLTGDLNVMKSHPRLFLKNTDVDKGTKPSGSLITSADFYDKNGKVMGAVRHQYNTNKDSIVELITYKANSDTDTEHAYLALTYPATGNPYAKAPNPTEDTEASQQIDTVGARNTKLKNYLPLSGGTMTGNITVSKNEPHVNLRNTEITKGTAPSATKLTMMNFYDKNGKSLGVVRHQYDTNKNSIIELLAYKANSNSDTQSTFLSLTYPATGSSYLKTVEIRPDDDNTRNLGISSVRWKQLYAGTTTIATSDERLKQNIETLPDNVLDAWGEVDFYRYKFIDAVKEKGKNEARYHIGMIAQRIEQIFNKHGLNAFDYGLLCYDEWEAEEEEKDEDGNIIRPAIEAGNRYSLRYEECLCMEAAYQRRRADRIEERLKALEEKLK